MKFRYYLRGAGIGIIITVLVMMVAFSKYKKELLTQNASGNAESKTVADLVKEEQNTDLKEEQNSSDDQSVQKDSEEKTDELSEEANPQNDEAVENDSNTTPNDTNGTTTHNKIIRITIHGGEYSDKVSKKLEEAGLIKDAEQYNSWLIANGYDQLMQPGTYDIPVGSLGSEIAKILTSRDN